MKGTSANAGYRSSALPSLIFDNATFLLDARRDYREIRRIAIGYLEERLHFLCFMEIPDGIHVISFRKANPKESRKHGKPLTINR